MPVTHVNRKRDTYYLHAGTTKTGKPRYWFARSTEGNLVESIPEGYEIYGVQPVWLQLGPDRSDLVFPEKPLVFVSRMA